MNVTRRSCDCHLKTKHCLCDEYAVQEPDVCELLMRFSVDMPGKEEQYCTLVWSDSLGEATPLEDFLLVMSKEKVKSYSLRDLLNNLSNPLKTMEHDRQSKKDVQDNGDIQKLQMLLDEIKKYANENNSLWPQDSVDYKEMLSLQEKIETALCERNVSEFEAFYSEWNKLRNGFVL